VLEKVRARPVEEWPTADRKAWEKACAVGHRLKPGGVASRMKPSTRASLVRTYGYLFDFCRRKALFDPNASAGAHVTPIIVDAFVQELRERVGSVTRLTYVTRIERVVSLLAAGRDLSWLREIEADLRYEARPLPKYHRIVSTHRLQALGLDLIGRGETNTHLTNLARARLMRNGLMISLLARCPSVGKFRRAAYRKADSPDRGYWWIVLEAAETKSGRPDERPVPEILTPHIDRWLEFWRPLFLEPADAFWSSTKGGSLAYTYVGQLITETTLGELGVAVNPHLFRDCAVYTVATEAGDRMGIASGLLQHTDDRTIQRHYNKGALIAATQRYHQVLDQLTGD